MKYLKRFIMSLLLLFSILVIGSDINSAFANANVWTDVDESNIILKGERRIVPQSYRTIRADIQQLTNVLQSAPFEFTGKTKSSPLIIELPLPDGGFSKFYVMEYSIMAPDLAAKYPDIKTYSIKGIDDPYATGKIDVSANGFHAMVLTVRGDYFIDPYSTNENEIYLCYYKKNYISVQPFECFVNEEYQSGNLSVNFRGAIVTGPELRTYRLALACTGEYSTYHGGTVALVHNALVTAMNRINGVYEKDFAVRMVFIPNNDTLIYLVASTDPYSNNNGGTMLGQNQTNLDNVIGNNNYDVGHVFSTGGGGVAFLSCVCVSSTKARGVTGLNAPIGDPFYIDYVAHEMGHQFGGNHSFNSTASACGGGNRNAATAWEPGSGSTIMSYAGICGSDNLQTHSDAYFHSGNFTEIGTNTQFGSGGTCPVIILTGNTPPVVTVPVSGFTIPISTPFILTGSAVDIENQNSLTYCWEEMDLGPAGSPNNPTGNAPTLRSFNPDTSSTRIFPRLTNLLNNTLAIGERLPSYARDLSFRLTVRDNSVAAGGVNYELVEFDVTASAGPFLLTHPNINDTLNSNVPHTITWNVANTDSTPVNCALVTIKLSTNGGNTFPATLVSNTPNDGSQQVSFSSLNTSTARVKVEAVGNIFFDISNVNFTLSNQVSVQLNGTGIPNDFSLSQNFPNPFNPSTVINYQLPVSGRVKLTLYNLLGNELETFVNQSQSAGYYTFAFDGSNYPSGIYIYKLEVNGDDVRQNNKNFVMTKRMSLIK